MAAIMDPHDKMRSKDLSKVATGQQAPRPAHEPGTVSAPPPLSSTKAPEDKANEKEAGKCYSSYLEYLKCTKQKGEGVSKCKKFVENCISSCPPEWVDKLEEERNHGIIHNH
ncbi:putative cytochrome c oxidase subunit 6b-like [Bidens hawaiensis]|uniref:putative cytochrome c oxidase subunit 6b-like n=1 Tax=Bidens hawaiensis TaxID=980011 RepID=UPI0040498362